jgi:uracil-DNA glycosylase
MGSDRSTNSPESGLTETIAALRWWAHAGVSSVIEERPRNFLAGKNTAIPTSRPTPPSVPSFRDASVVAASSPDLAALRFNMERFDGCALKKTATQLVFADGEPRSRVMFVGEAPGLEEDRVGRPFVGRAGQLLDRMLVSIGLDRRLVYVANVVPWRPPGNRTPTLIETRACLPFIKRQIELATPEFLVCLGASAMQTLLGVREGITRTRGQWFSYKCEDGRSLRAIAMLHPAYLLRQPGQKRNAWMDMQALKNQLRA